MRKKTFIIISFPEKSREIMRRLSFTPVVGSGQLVIKKRLGNSIIQNKKATLDNGK